MSKEKRIADAVKHVDDATSPLQTWREQFAHQVTPERFRLWLNMGREMPPEILTQLPRVLQMQDKDAFQHCCPDHVSAEEFCVAAANQSEPVRKTTRKKKDTTEK